MSHCTEFRVNALCLDRTRRDIEYILYVTKNNNKIHQPRIIDFANSRKKSFDQMWCVSHVSSLLVGYKNISQDFHTICEKPGKFTRIACDVIQSSQFVLWRGNQRNGAKIIQCRRFIDSRAEWESSQLDRFITHNFLVLEKVLLYRITLYRSMFSGKTRRQWKVAKCSSIIGMEVWQVPVTGVL